jgi:ectoine hydroxylase-related dioxygenase (phytanoyl-CoA dioxygenase family)
MKMIDEQAVMDYHRDGYVLLDNVFSQDEVNVMIAEIEGGSERIQANLRKRADTTGRTANLAVWYSLEDDVWSAASTRPGLVNGVRMLMGEDVAFFHGKVMLKEAGTGGSWEWHQDYGYWYNDGFVYPRMLSAFVALDAATVENGCLKVLKGSHRMGRVNHDKVAGQTGIDPRRVAHYERLFELVHVEMSPGSVLFFHSNLLHSSGPNDSDKHRRSFIVCFNALANPFMSDLGGNGPNDFACPVGAEDGVMKFAERV